MRNARRNTASAASKHVRNKFLAAAWMLAWLAALPAAAQEPAGWQQQALPATDSTKLIAIAGSADRSALGMLYTDAAPGRGDQLRLVTFDALGKQQKSAGLGARAEPLREHAGIAFDATGGAYVAATDEAGNLRLSRLDQRGAVTPFGKAFSVGSGTVKVGALLLARQGNLVVAGAVGSQGFVAAVSPQGELQWTRTFEELVMVLDIVDSDDGYLVAGGTPGEMFPEAVWLGRLGRDGATLGSESRPGPTRYAHLASDGRRIGLLYEKLAPGLESGSVVLELFAGGGSAALQQPARQTIFDGRLAAPFALAGGGGRFTAAGVADHGRLQVFDIDAAGKVAALYQGQAKAPAYIRYHSIDVVRGATAAWLAGLRSRADGPRRQFELVFARVPDR